MVRPMSAETIIALQAAMVDLSSLYDVARNFTELQAEAEGPLISRMTALGGLLRRAVRQDSLEEHLEKGSREIFALATEWRERIEKMRDTAAYREARDAYESGDPTRLAVALPALFSRICVLESAPDLYFPFSASSGQRARGRSPFLAPSLCADSLVSLLRNGIPADPLGTDDWWDQDFLYIACAASPDALESPIWLRARAEAVPSPVFTVVATDELRLYSPHFQAEFQIGFTEDVTDEWWLAYDGSFPEFRTALERELWVRGVSTSILSGSS